MLHVFVSSTTNDLQVYRLAVARALERAGFAAINMDAFEASPLTPRDRSLGAVEDADIFVGIYADRYGSRPADEDVSYTELELRQAEQNRMPKLCFIYEGDTDLAHSDPPGSADRLRMDALKASLEVTTKRFTRPAELGEKVVAALEAEANTVLAEREARDFLPYRAAVIGCTAVLAFWLLLGLLFVDHVPQPTDAGVKVFSWPRDFMGHYLTFFATSTSIALFFSFSQLRKEIGMVLDELRPRRPAVIAAVVAALLVLTVVFIEANGRYVLYESPLVLHWTEEIAEGAMVWVVATAFYLFAINPLILASIDFITTALVASARPGRLESFDFIADRLLSPENRQLQQPDGYGLDNIGNGLATFVIVMMWGTVPMWLGQLVVKGGFTRNAVLGMIIVNALTIGAFFLPIYRLRTGISQLREEGIRRLRRKKAEVLEQDSDEAASTADAVDDRISAIKRARMSPVTGPVLGLVLFTVAFMAAVIVMGSLFGNDTPG